MNIKLMNKIITACNMNYLKDDLSNKQTETAV